MPTAQKKFTISRAKTLRRIMTEGEKRLWAELKQWRTARGIHWRKQAPLGRYIVDFLCHGKMLVVEVDGEFHFTPQGMSRDEKRDIWMQSQGYRVFRINTGELSENFNGCVETILRKVGQT